MFSLFSASHSKFHPQTTTGFSLVELMVSIGIIILVLSIVITQQSTFNSAVLLRSQAYEIALTIREAQLGAVSAINDASGGVENFRQVIGVHFNTATPGRYILFADAGSPGNNFYTSGEAYGVPGLLDPRFEISEIRRNGSVVGSGALSVIFERPNFDARFKTTAGGPLYTTGIVQIDIQPNDGSGTGCPDDIRTIEITSTGQVSVLECP